MCGSDLLDAFIDGRISWSLADKGTFYTTQFAYQRSDGIHSSTTLQFYRHSHSNENDLGSDNKDQVYLILNGIDTIDWAAKSMAECFTKFEIGAMKIEEITNVEDNHAKCAGWDKDL